MLHCVMCNVQIVTCNFYEVHLSNNISILFDLIRFDLLYFLRTSIAIPNIDLKGKFFKSNTEIASAIACAKVKVKSTGAGRSSSSRDSAVDLSITSPRNAFASFQSERDLARDRYVCQRVDTHTYLTSKLHST